MDKDLNPPKDAKTTLQEYAQSCGKKLPNYREVSREGPAHDPIFMIEVSIDDEEPLSGTGGSKRHAEQIAATAMLARLGLDEGDVS